MSKKINYVTLESKESGLDGVKLLDEPFKGVVITYGKVTLHPDEEADTLEIEFDYSILENNGVDLSDPKPLEEYLGNLLVQLIDQGIDDNTLTYTGGGE